MSIDWFTFLAQLVNFLILLALLRHFLYGPILNVMDRREKEVTARLEDARLKLEQAEEKTKLYDQKLQAFENQKAEMIKAAASEAEAKKGELMHAAREEVDRVRKLWLETVEIEKRSYFKELYHQTADKIIGIADRIIRDLASREIERAVIEKFLAQLQAMDEEQRKQAIHSALDSGSGEIKIVSSFALSIDYQNQIRETIQQVLKSNVTCTFSESKLLGFGIEVRMPGWKLGWNVLSYLDELRQQMDRNNNNNNNHPIVPSQV